MMKYLKIKEKDSEIITELDFELYDYFDLTPDEVEFLYDDYPRWGHLLEIQELERILTKFKDSGSTHIAIDTDTDHTGYMMSGFDLEFLTNTEVEEKQKLEKQEAQLAKALTNDILKLIKKYNK